MRDREKIEIENKSLGLIITIVALVLIMWVITFIMIYGTIVYSF